MRVKAKIAINSIKTSAKRRKGLFDGDWRGCRRYEGRMWRPFGEGEGVRGWGDRECAGETLPLR